MMFSFLKECVVDKLAIQTANGTTAINTSIIDMTGFDAIAMIAGVGISGANSTPTLTLFENSSNSTVGATAITGGNATYTDAGTGNTTIIVDAIRPSKRFVFGNVTRPTTGFALDSVLAIRYRARTHPVTQSTNVAASAINGPEN